MLSGRLAKLSALAATAAILSAGALLWVERPASAADHLDPPSRTNVGTQSDSAADIADVFLWNSGNTVTVAVTGAGPKEAGVPATYDRDVVYRTHISNDGDPTTDEFVVDTRYGRDLAGNWGVQFLGIPGAAGNVQGPVQTVLTNGTLVKAVAGLFDDPFFFDLQGFNDTRATGVLSMTSTRNFFAGKNDTAFVFEFSRAVVDRGRPITVWVETRRITGA